MMTPASQRVVEWLWAQTWQLGLLGLALALAWSMSRKASAHWRYLLGLVVLLNSLLPALVPLPLPKAVRLVLLPVRSEEVAAKSRTSGEKSMDGALALQRSGQANPAMAVDVLAAIWASGALCMLMVGGTKAVRIQMRLRRTRVEPDLGLECEFLDLGRNIGLRHRPKLCLLNSAGQPFVWGLWRGCIYLSAAFPRGGGFRERRAVLAHELAHVLRWDALVNLVQLVAQAVFWFHPAMWWLNIRLRQEREKCCDEMAIAALDGDASAYGRALVNHLISQFSPAVPPSSLAISGRGKDLEDRLKAILRPGRAFRLRPSALAVAGVLMAAVLVLPTGFSARSRGVGLRNEHRAPPTMLTIGVAASEDWTAPGRPFEELPKGEQSMGEMSWVIGGVAPVYDAVPIMLTVHGKFRKLHLLHSLDGVAAEETVVGHIRLFYRDGQIAQLSVRYGEQVRNYRFSRFERLRDRASVMAWTGSNPETRAAGQGLRLYVTTFLNPRPGVVVDRIEYAAAARGITPLLAAVTLE